MLIHLVPTLFMVAVVGWFIRRHSGLPVVQLYALIVVSYLNIFPALNLLFSKGEGINSFAYYQLLIIGFFELPMLFFSHLIAGRFHRALPDFGLSATRLSPLLPLALGGMLVAFWFVGLYYDAFFRRLGHAGLARITAEVPALLLYLYRCTVETSIFVILFLCTILRCVRRDTRYYGRYRIVLTIYLVSFVLFFLANSRLQFVLLLLCLICTQPPVAEFFLRRRRMLKFGLFLLALVVGLTLFREVYLEKNNRLEIENLMDLLLGVGRLISARLDSIEILYRMQDAGFDSLSFDLTGVLHVVNFYLAFFTDPATYASIKESLVTSPSLAIVNRFLSVDEVDFPKSMILDMFLSFGVLGLVIAGFVLGSIIGWLQRQLKGLGGFSLPFIVSLYALPMLLQFEKEFMSLFVGFLKWIPMFALLYWARPLRRTSQRNASKAKAKTAMALGSEAIE
jgi:hypothetical protein